MRLCLREPPSAEAIDEGYGLSETSPVASSTIPTASASRGRSANPLRAWYPKGQLAASRYPRKVWFLDELPQGPTGKILEREIEVPQAVKTA